MPALAIGTGSSIVSGLLGARAAGKAAKQQAEAAQIAAAEYQRAGVNAKNDLTQNTTAANGVLGNVYDDLNGKINPYLAAGDQGVNMLTAAIQPGGSLSQQFAFNPKDLEKDPGYQFQLQEGLKAVKNAAAASGAGGAGGTMKSLVNFNQGLAGTSYNQAYQRAANTFDMNHRNTLQALMALTGVGENAVNQSIGVGQNYGDRTSGNYMNLGQGLANVGMKTAQEVGEAYTGKGNAEAAGTIGTANALTGAIKGIGQAGLDAWYARPGAGGGSGPRYSDGTLWNT